MARVRLLRPITWLLVIIWLSIMLFYNGKSTEAIRLTLQGILSLSYLKAAWVPQLRGTGDT